MAITAATRPLLIVVGAVQSRVQRFGFDREQNRRTSEVVGYEAVVQPDEGAPLRVRYDVEEGSKVGTGEVVAVYVSVQESREYGVFLNFERHLTGDDLEKIATDALQPAKAA